VPLADSHQGRALVENQIDNLRVRNSTRAMGIAISPLGDMLKNRVRLNSKDAPCRHSAQIPSLH
jgi:hypothetical protein